VSRRPVSTLSLVDAFRRLAHRCAVWVGTPIAFALSCLAVVAWAVTGPLFHYSDTWQLVINTGTTVLTFLIVFLIQATQNRDSQALHLKLDELIRAGRGRNRLTGIEDCSEDEMQELQREFAEFRKRLRG